MAVVNRATSKTKFETLDVPTQSDFEDWHDSIFWFQDNTASDIAFTPSGDIAATNTQSAIVEVRDDTDTKLLAKEDTANKGAASGYAPLNGSSDVPDANISQSSVTQHQAAIDHDSLANYVIAQHRIINDSGTSTTELWSASKISTELSTIISGMKVKAAVDTSTEGLGNIVL